MGNQCPLAIMYNFVTDVFGTNVEASSINFDLHQQSFADAKVFELFSGNS